MSNVVSIQQAKSFAAQPDDRYVDAAVFMHHFSLSRKTVTNYVNGYFTVRGERKDYPKGPIPHIKLPGGDLRFNLLECQRYFNSEVCPIKSE